MFARASAVFTLALPILAAANAIPRNDGPSNPCKTGTPSCCNSLQDASSASITGLLGLLGVVVGSVTELVGVTDDIGTVRRLGCSPISVTGVGSCTAQTVCCTDDPLNGGVALGCTPIN